MLTSRITFDRFFNAGGMGSVEREAAERAITKERLSWLPILEAWAAALDADKDDLFAIIYLDSEIRRLRRTLGLPPSVSPNAVERRRQQTRERVRRYRERQRQSRAAQ
jgi:hypothetical protein